MKRKMTQKDINKISASLKELLSTVYFTSVEPKSGKFSGGHAAVHMIVLMREAIKMGMLLSLQSMKGKKKNSSDGLAKKMANTYKMLKMSLDDEFTDLLLTYIGADDKTISKHKKLKKAKARRG